MEPWIDGLWNALSQVLKNCSLEEVSSIKAEVDYGVVSNSRGEVTEERDGGVTDGGVTEERDGGVTEEGEGEVTEERDGVTEKGDGGVTEERDGGVTEEGDDEERDSKVDGEVIMESAEVRNERRDDAAKRTDKEINDERTRKSDPAKEMFRGDSGGEINNDISSNTTNEMSRASTAETNALASNLRDNLTLSNSLPSFKV